MPAILHTLKTLVKTAQSTRDPRYLQNKRFFLSNSQIWRPPLTFHRKRVHLTGTPGVPPSLFVDLLDAHRGAGTPPSMPYEPTSVSKLLIDLHAE